jgi:hypothetical protein
MNEIERNKSNQTKPPQGQGGRTEETRQGREAMRGTTDKGDSHKLSAGEQEEIDEDFDDMDQDAEDDEEARLDDASEEDEDSGIDDDDRPGRNRSGRDDIRGQSDRI